MKITNETEEGLTLAVPPYRVDVQRDCDVVEDVLRIYGYNNVEIPTTLKSSLTPKGDCDRSNKLQNLVAEQLVGCGFNEILNNSLTRAAYYEGMETYPASRLVMLLNPLSADLNCMRQSLLFGGLESIAHNANRKNADLKFFEFGNCYYFDADKRNAEKVLSPYSEDYHLGLWLTGKMVCNSWAHADENSSGNCYYFDADKRNAEKVLSPYSEDYHLGLWLTGKMVCNSWAHADENSSVYELKAYVENIFKRLGLCLHNLVVGNLTDDVFAAALTVNTRGGKRLASFGVVHKKLLKAFDIDNEVYYADLNWKELMKAIRSVKVSYTEIKRLASFGVVHKKLLKAFDIDNEVYYADLNWKELMKAIRSVKVSYTEICKFPAVKRDLALLLDKGVQFCKFPAVKRDLALLLDKGVQFAEIEKIAYDTEKKLLKAVELFDVYEGKNLEAGKKSYAVSFLLQDENQTLNDKMIDKIMSKLVKNLQDKLGAKLR